MFAAARAAGEKTAVAFSGEMSFPSASGSAMEGYLHKTGGGRISKLSWKRRFFFFRGPYLLYCESPSDRDKPLGKISVADILSVSMGTVDRSGPKKFRDFGILVETLKRTFQMLAENAEDQLRWVEAVRGRRSALASTNSVRASFAIGEIGEFSEGEDSFDIFDEHADGLVSSPSHDEMRPDYVETPNPIVTAPSMTQKSLMPNDELSLGHNIPCMELLAKYGDLTVQFSCIADRVSTFTAGQGSRLQLFKDGSEKKKTGRSIVITDAGIYIFASVDKMLLKRRIGFSDMKGILMDDSCIGFVVGLADEQLVVEAPLKRAGMLKVLKTNVPTITISSIPKDRDLRKEMAKVAEASEAESATAASQSAVAGDADLSPSSSTAEKPLALGVDSSARDGEPRGTDDGSGSAGGSVLTSGDFDMMNIAKDPEFQAVLRSYREKVVEFSSYCEKINKKGTRQRRLIVVCRDALYNFIPGKKPELKRVVQLKNIERVVFDDNSTDLLAVIVPGETDYLLASDRRHILARVMQSLRPEIAAESAPHLKDLISLTKTSDAVAKRDHELLNTAEEVRSVLDRAMKEENISEMRRAIARAKVVPGLENEPAIFAAERSIVRLQRRQNLVEELRHIVQGVLFVGSLKECDPVSSRMEPIMKVLADEFPSVSLDPAVTGQVSLLRDLCSLRKDLASAVDRSDLDFLRLLQKRKRYAQPLADVVSGELRDAIDLVAQRCAVRRLLLDAAASDSFDGMRLLVRHAEELGIGDERLVGAVRDRILHLMDSRSRRLDVVWKLTIAQDMDDVLAAVSGFSCSAVQLLQSVLRASAGPQPDTENLSVVLSALEKDPQLLVMDDIGIDLSQSSLVQQVLHRCKGYVAEEAASRVARLRDLYWTARSVEGIHSFLEAYEQSETLLLREGHDAELATWHREMKDALASVDTIVDIRTRFGNKDAAAEWDGIEDLPPLDFRLAERFTPLRELDDALLLYKQLEFHLAYRKCVSGLLRDFSLEDAEDVISRYRMYERKGVAFADLVSMVEERRKVLSVQASDAISSVGSEEYVAGDAPSSSGSDVSISSEISGSLESEAASVLSKPSATDSYAPVHTVARTGGPVATADDVSVPARQISKDQQVSPQPAAAKTGNSLLARFDGSEVMGAGGAAGAATALSLSVSSSGPQSTEKAKLSVLPRARHRRFVLRSVPMVPMRTEPVHAADTCNEVLPLLEDCTLAPTFFVDSPASLMLMLSLKASLPAVSRLVLRGRYASYVVSLSTEELLESSGSTGMVTRPWAPSVSDARASAAVGAFLWASSCDSAVLVRLKHALFVFAPATGFCLLSYVRVLRCTPSRFVCSDASVLGRSVVGMSAGAGQPGNDAPRGGKTVRTVLDWVATCPATIPDLACAVFEALSVGRNTSGGGFLDSLLARSSAPSLWTVVTAVAASRPDVGQVMGEFEKMSAGIMNSFRGGDDDDDDDEMLDEDEDGPFLPDEDVLCQLFLAHCIAANRLKVVLTGLHEERSSLVVERGYAPDFRLSVVRNQDAIASLLSSVGQVLLRVDAREKQVWLAFQSVARQLVGVMQQASAAPWPRTEPSVALARSAASEPADRAVAGAGSRVPLVASSGSEPDAARTDSSSAPLEAGTAGILSASPVLLAGGTDQRASDLSLAQGPSSLLSSPSLAPAKVPVAPNAAAQQPNPPVSPLAALADTVGQLMSLRDGQLDESANRDIGLLIRRDLCNALADVLLPGFKRRRLLKRDYTLWDIFSVAAGNQKALSTGPSGSILRAAVQVVDELVNNSVSDGGSSPASDAIKFRTLVCYGLNYGLLHDILRQVLLVDRATLAKFFDDGDPAVLVFHAAGAVVAAVASLERQRFKLILNLECRNA